MGQTRLLTIKQKLVGLTVLVSSIVLVFATVLFTYYEVSKTKNETAKNLASLARLLAAGSLEPLANKDIQQAESILKQASSQDSIVSAYLLDQESKSIAHYIRTAKTSRQVHAMREMRLFEIESRQISEGVKAKTESTWFEGDFVGHFVPIVFEGSYLGALYLRADLDFFVNQLLWISLISLIVLGVSVVLAYYLAHLFQKKLAGSVSAMATHVQEIVSSNEWAPLNIPPASSEFKTLFSGFDELMVALNDRDAAIKNHQLFLEEEVANRTRELTVANEDLSQAKASAEQANRAKSLFLANVSHEIRTPMVGVLGMADLLRQSDMEDRHRDLADTVHRSAQSLMALLEDLLDFSKIEAGKLRLVNEPFNLRQITDDVVRLMANRAFAKGLNFNFVMLPDVPERFDGDAGRIRQMVLNLVGNAIKFTEGGDVEVRIRHQPGPGDGTVLIDVRDTGIGISTPMQKVIFDSFQQGDQSEGGRWGGTGLGLAIVKELAMLMGGDVQVFSVPGQGSRFTLRLPLTIDDPVGFDPGVTMHLCGNRAVLAIKNTFYRNSLNEILGGFGLQVEMPESEEELLEILSQSDSGVEKYHLLLDPDYLEKLPEIFGVRSIQSAIVLQADMKRTNLLETKSQLALQHVSLPIQMRELSGALLSMTKRALPVDSDKKNEESIPQSRKERSSAGGARILVAEDNPDSQRLLEILLSSAGYDVTMTDNGQDAVNAIVSGDFDLAFMDCQMPVLDGYAATRTVRAQGVTLPIIALTAFSRNEEFKKCLDAGMNDFLSKPFRQQSLFQILEKWGVKEVVEGKS